MRLTVKKLASDDIDRRKIIEELEALGIPQPNKWLQLKINDMAKAAKFVFRTKAMEALWKDEIRGQITDGMWEDKVRLSDLFWYDIPTGVGGKTQVQGKAPSGARTNFQLREMADASSGISDRVLALVQQHEPGATLDDVVVYLDEIAAAMRVVDKEEIRAPTPAPSATPGAASDIEKIRHELEWKLGVKNPTIVAETIMVGKYGARTNQYHYFVIWQDPSSGEHIGANAYGSFGKAPKSVELARGDLDRVQRKVQSKIRAKSGDYELKPDLTPNKTQWRWAASPVRVAMRFLERR